MPLPRIYIINLRRTPERKLYMQRQLDAFGLDYQFVDAVDKLELNSKEYRAQTAHQISIDESQMEHLYNNHKNNQRVGEGGLACKLSHIRAYDLIIQHKVPLACVLEDDGYLRPAFPKILNRPELFQEPSWDILMLSHRATEDDNLPFHAKNLFCDMLRGRFYKLIHHKKHYPRLLSSSYFTCLIIWKEVCYYSKRLFNLYPQYLESHEIGAIPDMKKSSCYKIGFNRYISKPHTLNTLIASGMGYILTLSSAIKYKEAALQIDDHVDNILFYLYEDGKIDLRIVVPPCISAIKNYVKYSNRHPQFDLDL